MYQVFCFLTKKSVIKSSILILLFKCSFVFASSPSAPVLLAKTEGLFVTLSWTKPNNIVGYRLSYVPLALNIDLNELSTLDFDVGTKELSIMLPPEANYLVAIQAFNDDGLSNYSNIEIANPDIKGKALQQINRYLNQWSNYEFNNFISLGDYDLFTDTMYRDELTLFIEETTPAGCPDSLACFDAGYNVFGYSFGDTSLWITSYPESMSDSNGDLWHEMLHAINRYGNKKFTLDGGNANHTQINYGERIAQTALRNVAGFEDYASEYIESYTEDIADRARKKWGAALDVLAPFSFTTQEHIDDLKTIVGFDVDPEKIKEGYIDLGYPREFFELDYRISFITTGTSIVRSSIASCTWHDQYSVSMAVDLSKSLFNLTYETGGSSGVGGNASTTCESSEAVSRSFSQSIFITNHEFEINTSGLFMRGMLNGDGTISGDFSFSESETLNDGGITYTESTNLNGSF